MTSRERYDGKTRQDDIKKWVPIGLIIAIICIAGMVGFHRLKKAYAPDYTIVDMCNGTLNEHIQEHIKETVGSVIGDKNGNGNVNVSIKSLVPAYMSSYSESAAAMFTGDYVLFFMLDPAPWNEDVLAIKTDLTGTKLWEEWSATYGPMHLYACVLNTNDKDMEEAQRIIDAFLAEEDDTSNPNVLGH